MLTGAQRCPQRAEADGWDTYIKKGVYLTLCSLTVQSLANFKLSRKQSNSGRSRVCFMTAFTIPYLYYKVCTLEVLAYTSSVGFCIVARFKTE